MLEKEIYNWFAEEDRFFTAQDVYDAFPGESRASINAALDSLCVKGAFYKIPTAFGEMYGIDSTEEDDTYTVDTSTGSGIGDMLRAMGAFDGYVPISKTIIEGTSLADHGIDEINAAKYIKASYSSDDVMEWMNTIGSNREFLNAIKQVTLNQLVQRLQTMNLGDKFLPYFEGLARIELEEIAKARANLYKKIEEVWTLVKVRLTDTRMLNSLSNELVKIVSDEEDMTINGGQLRFAVAIKDSDYYKKSFSSYSAMAGINSNSTKETPETGEVKGRKTQNSASSKIKEDINIENEEQYQNAVFLMEKAKTKTDYKKAITALKKIINYKDSVLLIDRCSDEINALEKESKYKKALSLFEKKSLDSFDSGIKILESLGEYKNSKSILEEMVNERKQIAIIEEKKEQVQEEEWQRKRKDALLAKGLASCTSMSGYFAFVKQDGTVTVDASRLSYHEKDNLSRVVEEVKKWRDIKAVATVSDGGIVGLKWDGTCVYAVTKGKEKEYVLSDVSHWKDIAYIDSNELFCVGLDKSGRCYSTNQHNYSNQKFPNKSSLEVSNWKDVMWISCGDYDSVCCVKKDGTVLTTEDFEIAPYVKGVKLAASGAHHFVRYYKKSGEISQDTITKFVEPLPLYKREKMPIDIKVIHRGIYILYEDNVMRAAKNDTENVIGMNPYTMGNIYVTSDGYVHKNTDTYKIFDDFSYYRDHDKIVALKKQEEKEKKEMEEKQKAEYRSKGVCQYCGGIFKKTLFGAKCLICGKKKDY